MQTIENSTEVAGRDVDVSRGTNRYEVSRQWMSRPEDQRFTSLDELAAVTKARYMSSTTELVDNKKLELIAPEPHGMEDLTRMYVGMPNGDVVSPTHWSFGQMAGLAQAPGSYLRKLPAQLAADCFKWGLVEEGHKARSIWDVAQGMTAVARDSKHNDARLDLERDAGKLLDMAL